MKLVVAAIAAALTIPTATALARAPITHPEARAWIYADDMAQRGAEWMFPHASAPFGTVSTARGCDEQVDGSYECACELYT